jgi:hypothetical protein
MLLRFLIIVILIYLAGKLIKNLLNPPRKETEIKGKPRKNEPLDLSKYDVEDADFEEIDE